MSPWARRHPQQLPRPLLLLLLLRPRHCRPQVLQQQEGEGVVCFQLQEPPPLLLLAAQPLPPLLQALLLVLPQHPPSPAGVPALPWVLLLPAAPLLPLEHCHWLLLLLGRVLLPLLLLRPDLVPA
jgi:hypothetical protein